MKSLKRFEGLRRFRQNMAAALKLSVEVREGLCCSCCLFGLCCCVWALEGVATNRLTEGVTIFLSMATAANKGLRGAGIVTRSVATELLTGA
jgi:hypothetical protein